MRILVCIASRHRSTEDIGGGIARELRAKLSGEHPDLRIDVREAHQRIDVTSYDAAVVGSALYMGKWLPAARTFLTTNAEALAAIPVWLFSSGPLGDPPVPAAGPAAADDLVRAVHAREHKVFAGRLDKALLSLGERAITRGVRAPYGDYRDWDAIASWADGVADALAAEWAR